MSESCSFQRPAIVKCLRKALNPFMHTTLTRSTNNIIIRRTSLPLRRREKRFGKTHSISLSLALMMKSAFHSGLDVSRLDSNPERAGE
jgi:hypothetical protein